MRRFNYRQYRIWVKFCKDLFLKKGYINQQKLNEQIQEKLGANSTHYRRKFIDMKLLSERNKLLYPGSLLYRFKQADFYFINKLTNIGEIKMINDEIHLFPVLNMTLKLPNNWKLIENSAEKQVFKLLS
ncbi:hypothetical protein [Elizabethkingia anophelis]|uniref:hypothetical protein n=1 Tax=Elizabethkingia anophelis TaxID=1117645 RepID=UPI000442BC38|nr:hypothetical protein [Elizabethkingia anophelis]CDN79521.1 hypothetical protein E27107_60095 [Elizabethkingia anophelis]